MKENTLFRIPVMINSEVERWVVKNYPFLWRLISPTTTLLVLSSLFILQSFKDSNVITHLPGSLSQTLSNITVYLVMFWCFRLITIDKIDFGKDKNNRIALSLIFHFIVILIIAYIFVPSNSELFSLEKHTTILYLSLAIAFISVAMTILRASTDSLKPTFVKFRKFDVMLLLMDPLKERFFKQSELFLVKNFHRIWSFQVSYLIIFVCIYVASYLIVRLLASPDAAAGFSWFIAAPLIMLYFYVVSNRVKIEYLKAFDFFVLLTTLPSFLINLALYVNTALSYDPETIDLSLGFYAVCFILCNIFLLGRALWIWLSYMLVMILALNSVHKTTMPDEIQYWYIIATFAALLATTFLRINLPVFHRYLVGSYLAIIQVWTIFSAFFFFNYYRGAKWYEVLDEAYGVLPFPLTVSLIYLVSGLLAVVPILKIIQNDIVLPKTV
jgi:hypothetical protein